jgi:hypothetical protein
MACAVCETRRPRRFCPGVGREICSLCCGAEREVTIDCPFECEYLQEARKRDRPAPASPAAWPNQDIQIDEEFLADHEDLLVSLGSALAVAASNPPGTVDFDVREALDSLIRTYRTLESGVYYETIPPNPLAANLHRQVQAAVTEFRRKEQQRLGITRTRDADVLRVLVFLQRIELDRNNGRRRGRAFLDGLRGLYSGVSAGAGTTGPSPLILP